MRPPFFRGLVALPPRAALSPPFRDLVAAPTRLRRRPYAASSPPIRDSVAALPFAALLPPLRGFVAAPCRLSRPLQDPSRSPSLSSAAAVAADPAATTAAAGPAVAAAAEPAAAAAVGPAVAAAARPAAAAAAQPTAAAAAGPAAAAAAEPAATAAAEPAGAAAARPTAAAAADPAAAAAADPAAAAATGPPAATAADPAAAAVAEPAAAAAARPAAAATAGPAAAAAVREYHSSRRRPCSSGLKFDTWLDDLHLFLQLTAKEDISLYDHALGHATAPDTTADSTLRSQWQTRDAHARFAIRNSLPLDEREHFGQCKTAKELYTAVVARYSSPASAALGRLSLPYLFPDLASFHTVADLITHLKTIRDSFLARSPTELTIALLEKDLLAAEASIVAVGASRGEPRTPFFEGCSPSPLLPSVASASAVDLLGAEKVGAASASSGRRRTKGGKGGGGGRGGGGGGGGSGGGGAGETSGGSGGSDGSGGGGGRGGGGSGGGGGRGSGRGGGGRGGGSGGGGRGGAGGGPSQQHTPSLQEAREWYAQRGGAGGLSCTYVIRTGDRAGQTCGKPHPTPRCFARLDDAWRTQFPDGNELPRWFDLEKKGVDIWALDFDAILTAMYAMFTSGEGAQYLRVPPDPGILTSEAAALGASASAAPGARVSATPGAGEAAALGAGESVSPGTESTAALHTFTLDSGASRCFFRDRTALEPLARPVAVSLADPSGGPVIATSSTVLPCPAVPSGTLTGVFTSSPLPTSA
ncbi:unnamed protein product [Closterium sp. Yama58-4]|nr:unnamed protein product [Closterium sp. Yama58-4]